MFKKKEQKKLDKIRLLCNLKGSSRCFEDNSEVLLSRCMEYAEKIDAASDSGTAASEMDIAQKNFYLELSCVYSAMSRTLKDLAKDLEALV